MLFRPNSRGLEMLEEAIREHKDGMSNEMLQALTNAYEMINEEVGEAGVLDLDDVEEKVYEFVKGIDFKITNIFENVEKLLEDIESEDEVYDSIYRDVLAEFEKYEFEEFIYDSDSESNNSCKTQMKKMMDMGYRFNCEMSKEIQKEHDAEVIKLEQEKKDREYTELLKKHEEKFSQKWEEYRENINLLLDVRYIGKRDANTYELRRYDELDVLYNSITQKISGKGSRKYKEQVIEYVNHYIEFMNKMSS